MKKGYRNPPQTLTGIETRGWEGDYIESLYRNPPQTLTGIET